MSNSNVYMNTLLDIYDESIHRHIRMPIPRSVNKLKLFFRAVNKLQSGEDDYECCDTVALVVSSTEKMTMFRAMMKADQADDWNFIDTIGEAMEYTYGNVVTTPSFMRVIKDEFDLIALDDVGYNEIGDRQERVWELPTSNEMGGVHYDLVADFDDEDDGETDEEATSSEDDSSDYTTDDDDAFEVDETLGTDDETEDDQ